MLSPLPSGREKYVALRLAREMTVVALCSRGVAGSVGPLRVSTPRYLPRAGQQKTQTSLVTARVARRVNSVVCRADASDGLDSYDDDAESAVFVNQLAQQITTAAADMKIEQLEVCANHAMKEAELLEGQADAIEKEAAHIEKVVEKALAVETDEFQIKVKKRMRAVARLDAKEQRMYADAVRAIADKQFLALETARHRKELGGGDGGEQ